MIFTHNPWENDPIWCSHIFQMGWNSTTNLGMEILPFYLPKFNQKRSPLKSYQKNLIGKYVFSTSHHFFTANFAVKLTRWCIGLVFKKIRRVFGMDPTITKIRVVDFPTWIFCSFHFSAPHLAGGQRSGDLQLRGGRWVVPWCLDWWNPVGPLISTTRDAYLKRLDMHRMILKPIDGCWGNWCDICLI